MTEENLTFRAETSKLLKIVANSLYSRREVFLRELISNASDACDRLRYEALTMPELAAGDADYCVKLHLNAKAKTLTVEDNGIGMGRDELIENLGTIARSGSSEFLEKMKGDDSGDMSLIGQFGVGFYSAFIVADKVVVLSRRAGAADAWQWSSDGTEQFQISEAERESRGTSVILHLKKDAKEFLDTDLLRRTVKAHSDHIGIPVVLAGVDGSETLNSASALWTRPKREISQDQYKEFYQHVGHGFDDPWTTVHVRAEGRLEYTMLLFVPSTRPLDLFQPDRKCAVRLYVRRVFVTDDCKGLLPPYLRFICGVVDTEDIALNVSREMLQQDPILSKIGAAVVKRILAELDKRAKKDPEAYETFWKNFGPVLKEGLYEDAGRRDQILGLARFHSTHGEGLVSLKEYISRMTEEQEAIYTIAGDDVAALRSSPNLEGYAARGAEVLLLTDPVDEFWVPAVGNFREKPFVSVTRGDAGLDKLKPKEPASNVEGEGAKAGDIAVLVALLKQSLGDKVKEIRVSERLTTSAVCLVADDTDLDRHLARMLSQHGQLDHVAAGILELNPAHSLIKSLAESAQKTGSTPALEDAAHLLLDQARIVDGDPPTDSAAFARRLTALLERAT